MAKDKSKEFRDFISAELEEMERYIKDNPKKTRDEAAEDWVKKYAASFRKDYDDKYLR